MRLRLGYFTLALLVLMNHSSCYAQQPNQPATGEIQTSSDTQSVNDGFGIPIRIVDPSADEQAQREAADLLAQQSVATSTEEIVQWTRLQFALTALGTVALLYTLYLNRVTTRAAVTASDAANKALGAERAWMLMIGTGTGGGYLKTPAGIQTIWGVNLRWRNDGRSPALAVKTVIDFREITDINAIPEFPSHDMSDDPTVGIVGPGNEVSTVRLQFPPAQLERLLSQEAHFIIFSRVEYRDTFKPDVTRVSEGLYAASLFMTEVNGKQELGCTLQPVGNRNTAV